MSLWQTSANVRIGVRLSAAALVALTAVGYIVAWHMAPIPSALNLARIVMWAQLPAARVPLNYHHMILWAPAAALLHAASGKQLREASRIAWGVPVGAVVLVACGWALYLRRNHKRRRREHGEGIRGSEIVEADELSDRTMGEK